MVVPEEGSTPKVQTALEAGNPPDVALLEPDLIATVKAGRWVDLVPFLKFWGVNVADFNAGGLSWATIENDESKGIAVQMLVEGLGLPGLGTSCSAGRRRA